MKRLAREMMLVGILLAVLFAMITSPHDDLRVTFAAMLTGFLIAPVAWFLYRFVRWVLPVILLFAFFAAPPPAAAQAVVSMATPPKLQFFNENGQTLSGGCVFTYQSGTSTALATYTDYTGSIQNPNPVILDSGGFASIWLQQQAYRFVVYSSGGTNCSSGSQQYVIDGIVPACSLATSCVIASASNSFTGPNSFAGTTTFNGPTIFVGAMTLPTAGVNLGSGVYTGNPQFSGNPSFSGSPIFGNMTMSGTVSGNPTFSGHPTFTSSNQITIASLASSQIEIGTIPSAITPVELNFANNGVIGWVSSSGSALDDLSVAQFGANTDVLTYSGASISGFEMQFDIYQELSTGFPFGVSGYDLIWGSGIDHMLHENLNNGVSGQLPSTIVTLVAYTNSTTTITATPFTFFAAPNDSYTVSCHLYYQAVSTGGLAIEFVSSASGFIEYGLNEPLSASTFNTQTSFGYGGKLGAAVSTANTTFDAVVTAGITTSGTGGQVTIWASSVAAAQLTIEPESWCRIQ